jgi:hypothetical protein
MKYIRQYESLLTNKYIKKLVNGINIIIGYDSNNLITWENPNKDWVLLRYPFEPIKKKFIDIQYHETTNKIIMNFRIDNFVSIEYIESVVAKYSEKIQSYIENNNAYKINISDVDKIISQFNTNDLEIYTNSNKFNL